MKNILISLLVSILSISLLTVFLATRSVGQDVLDSPQFDSTTINLVDVWAGQIYATSGITPSAAYDKALLLLKERQRRVSNAYLGRYRITK